jgi:protein phosphatase
MVGTDSMGEPEVQRLQVQPGQTVLLYSDGLHQGLDSLQIAEVLDALGADIEAAATELVTGARRNGSTDDISVLCARWEPSEANQAIRHADRWRLAGMIKSLLGAS